MSVVAAACIRNGGGGGSGGGDGGGDDGGDDGVDGDGGIWLATNGDFDVDEDNDNDVDEDDDDASGVAAKAQVSMPVKPRPCPREAAARAAFKAACCGTRARGFAKVRNSRETDEPTYVQLKGILIT